MLVGGLPGAYLDCIATQGPVLQLLISTNFASPGHIFSMAPSIFDSSMAPSCLNEHRSLLHFPKNR